MLGVLTIKLYLLSKPVTPIVVTGAVTGVRLFDVLRCKDSAKKGKLKTDDRKLLIFNKKSLPLRKIFARKKNEQENCCEIARSRDISR